MGILYVLLFWGLVGLGLAVVGAFVARKMTASLVPPKLDPSKEALRKRAVRYATLLPFACFVWAAAVFGFQGFVNTTFLHRDIGLGDSFYCPLPNGYSILMIDVADRGTIYNPKTQMPIGNGKGRKSAVSGVRRLQVAGPELLGAVDTRYAQDFSQPNPRPDRYFLLDTRTGDRADFPTENALRAAASNRGIRLKLEPIFSVYRRYRVTSFDFAAVCLLFLPLILLIAILLRWIVRLRRAQNAPGPSNAKPARA